MAANDMSPVRDVMEKSAIERHFWLIFVVASVYLCGEYFLLGPFSALPTHDNAEQYIPIYINHAQRFLEPGNWLPFAAAGVDRISLGYFNGVDTLLFDLFHPVAAFALLKLIHVGAALAGVYLLARRRLSLDVEAAVFAALVFAIGAAAGHLFGSVRILTPLLIFLIGYALDGGRSPLRWAILAAAVVFFTFAAFPQFLVSFFSVFVVLWFLAVERRRSVAAWVIILGVAALPPLLRLPDFLALAANAPISMRSMDVVETGFLASLPRLGEHLVPHAAQEYLYFTMGLLGLAAIAVGDRKSMPLAYLFLLCIATVAALIGLKAWLVEGPLAFAKGFNVVRLMQFMPMILALAAGFGYRFVRTWASNGGNGVRHAVPVILVGAWFLVSLEPKVENLRDWVSQGNVRNNLESPLIERFAAKVRADVPPPRIAAHQFYASYLPAYGLEVTGGALTLFPRRYREFWELVIRPMAESDPEMHALLTANKLRLRMTTYRKESKVEFARYYDLDLLSLANTRYLLSRDELRHPDLDLIHDSAGNWNDLDRTGKIKSMVAANFRGRELMKIYENRRVLPRVFVPDQIRTFETTAELFDAMAAASAESLRRTLLASKSDLPIADFSRTNLGAVAAKIVSYSSDEIRIDVKAEDPGVVVIANSFSPFWRCRSPLLEGSLFPAYHAFWAILVNKGSGRVVCRYEPPYSWANLSTLI